MVEKRIFKLSWPASLRELAKIEQVRGSRDARIAFLGVGNELNGDDAIGLAVIKCLKKDLPALDRFLLIEAGPVPEAFTSTLRRFQPDYVIIIDAVWMNLPPGQPEWIEVDQVDALGVVTHGLPLSILIEFLTRELGCQVMILGVQGENSQYGTSMSLLLARAARRISRELARLVKLSSQVS